MDIAGYMSKKKLLGAKKSDIVKYYELFGHKSEIDLVEALTLDKEAIFRVKINENEEVVLKDRVYESLEKNVGASIDEYTDNDGNIWLTDLMLKQNTPYSDFNLRIDLLAFDNGKKIAIRNYWNGMLHPVKIDTLGYCIAFKIFLIERDENEDKTVLTDMMHIDDRLLVIDKELNKYICVSSETAGYYDYMEYKEHKELGIEYNSDSAYNLKILEKTERISLEQIKEIEIIS